MWDPPGPGTEPPCPALAGGFLTIGPPGQSLVSFLKMRENNSELYEVGIDSRVWSTGVDGLWELSWMTGSSAESEDGD